jgi:hypothetical protein
VGLNAVPQKEWRMVLSFIPHILSPLLHRTW